jgi:hypothetical protein
MKKEGVNPNQVDLADCFRSIQLGSLQPQWPRPWTWSCVDHLH